jgi:hypothetical protein
MAVTYALQERMRPAAEEQHTVDLLLIGYL